MALKLSCSPASLHWKNSFCKEQNLCLAPRWGIEPCRAFCFCRVTLFWLQRVYRMWTCWKCSSWQKDTFLMLAPIPSQLWWCFFSCQAPHRASSQRRDLLRLMQTALPVKPSPLPSWFFLCLYTTKSFPKGSQGDVSNTQEYPCLWVQAEHFAFVCPSNPLNFMLTQTRALPQLWSSDSSHSRTLSRILVASREQGSDVF